MQEDGDLISGRDTLFLLPPGFLSGERREYCPECAEVWGLLGYFPALKETIEVVYEPLAHPRPGLVARLGPGAWNCPTLLLANASPDGDDVKSTGEVRYLDSARAIGRYFAQRFGTPAPRGGP